MARLWRGYGALQAPSLAANSGQGPVGDTDAGPVVPAAGAPGDPEGLGYRCCCIFHSDAESYRVQRDGDGCPIARTCGLGMALKAMADSEKNPILIDGAPALCNLLVKKIS